MPTVAAVDFGASSIRVCRVDLSGDTPTLEVVHRYAHGPVRHGDGSLRWDWDRLVAEMERGLEVAMADGPLASIGVDAWGVDYGLLDAHGELVAPPFSYRDDRTADYELVLAKLGAERLYAATGVQVQPFNTVFQLAAHRPDELAAARHLLLLPELLVHHLTGAIVGEPSSAGTTGLFDPGTRTWVGDVAEAVGVDTALLPDLHPATTAVGSWRGVPVHLVGGHDTASAAVAMGAEPTARTVFASAGTWLLVGRERPGPDRSDAARHANLSNEVGALGGVRLLRNVAGFWVLERCLDSWPGATVDAVLGDAAHAAAVDCPADLTDPAFLNPPDMLAAFTAAAGLDSGTEPAVVASAIMDAMARAATTVIGQLGGAADVALFGGGARAPLLGQRIAERVGVPVHRGPTEATALGNALVQGVALGRFADLADARRSLGGWRER